MKNDSTAEDSVELERKVSSQGGKMPYFHRVLSDQDVALIGDITPKPIVSSMGSASTSIERIGNDGISPGGRSAWNSAGTYEEKNCTDFAKLQLLEIFTGPKQLLKNQGYTVNVLSISSISGSAQVAHSRGKNRYLYELSFVLSLEVTDEHMKKSRGEMSVTEVENDLLDDMIISVEWSDREASAPKISGGAVKEALINTLMNTFEPRFVEAFSSSASTTVIGVGSNSSNNSNSMPSSPSAPSSSSGPNSTMSLSSPSSSAAAPIRLQGVPTTEAPKRMQLNLPPPGLRTISGSEIGNNSSSKNVPKNGDRKKKKKESGGSSKDKDGGFLVTAAAVTAVIVAAVAIGTYWQISNKPSSRFV